MKFLAVTVLMSAYLATTTLSFAGAGSSGGGNRIMVDGCPVLLDLFLINKGAGSNACEPGFQLPNTKALNALTLDRINNENSPVVSEANKYLEPWKKGSPVVTGLIEEALKRAPFYYTTYEIAHQDTNYFIPKAFSKDVDVRDLKTIAYYAKDFGVLIPQSDFNSMSKKNQIGILIHESLRHVSIQYGYQMSNDSIQKITAAIVGRKSVKNESLDTQKYLDGELLEKIQGPQVLKREIKESALRACKVASKYKEKMSDETKTQLKKVCAANDSTLDLLEVATEMRNSISSFLSYDDFFSLMNIESNLITYSVSESLNSIDGDIRTLGDVTLEAKHATGIDLAIHEANRSIGWLTGSKRQIRKKLKSLVKTGFLR